jgi:hypothetical protein
MAAYIIGYDLNKPEQDYPELNKAIKAESGTWWHKLDSTWIIVSDRTAKQIRDDLGAHIGNSDELRCASIADRSQT